MHLMNVYWSNSHREAGEIFIWIYFWWDSLVYSRCWFCLCMSAAHFQAIQSYMKPNAGYPSKPDLWMHKIWKINCRATISAFNDLQGLFEVAKGITVPQELHSGNYCLAGARYKRCFLIRAASPFCCLSSVCGVPQITLSSWGSETCCLLFTGRKAFPMVHWLAEGSSGPAPGPQLPLHA